MKALIASFKKVGEGRCAEHRSEAYSQGWIGHLFWATRRSLVDKSCSVGVLGTDARLE